MNGIEMVVKAIIGIIVFVIWTAIGLLYWVPMLIKATILFSIELVRNSISPGQENALIKRNLSAACVFYTQGYKKIWDTLFSRKTEPRNEEGKKRVFGGIYELVMETLFTIVFWLTVFLPILIIGLIGLIILLIIDMCTKYTGKKLL